MALYSFRTQIRFRFRYQRYRLGQQLYYIYLALQYSTEIVFMMGENYMLVTLGFGNIAIALPEPLYCYTLYRCQVQLSARHIYILVNMLWDFLLVC